jgi:type II secretory pathway component PulF
MPGITTPRKLSRRAEFFHQFAQLISAGLPAIQALSHLRQRPPDRSFRPRIDQVLASIEQGATFTEAIRATGDWLPSFDLALIEAGERSGRLPAACQLLGRYYEERASMIRTQLAYLIYPVFLFHFAFLIFPVNRLVAMIVEGNLAGYVQQKVFFFAPIYALVFLLLLAFQSSGKKRWRGIIERVLHPIPALGEGRRSLALARLSVSLDALISAGVPIVESWSLAAKASGSSALEKTVASARPRLEAGNPPGEMVSSSRVFPSHFASLYHSGEISGQLDESLARLAAFYQEEGARKLKIFFVALSSIVIGGVMLLIAWQILSFYIGHFQQYLQVL